MNGRIAALYGRIPKMTCLAGCSDCCGPVPWAESEWARMTDRRRQETLTCPYVGPDHRCQCYDRRPLLCRLFGTVERMRCPRGMRPDRMLAPDVENEIMTAYMREFNR